jgi:hypothetical protein
MGEESPLGAGTFHFTFNSGPNLTGGCWSSATPEPFGPRNLGHARGWSAPKLMLTSHPTVTMTIKFFIAFPSMLGISAILGKSRVGAQPLPAVTGL